MTTTLPASSRFDERLAERWEAEQWCEWALPDALYGVIDTMTPYFVEPLDQEAYGHWLEGARQRIHGRLLRELFAAIHDELATASLGAHDGGLPHRLVADLEALK